jgi:hypothetical protein
VLGACSHGGEASGLEVRDGDTVKAAAEQQSSRILDIIALKGKVTDNGARTTRCADYDSDEEVYRARHPWSVYQVPLADVQKAMDRLRDGLPNAVDVRLLDERKYSDDPSLLEVTVESACYRAK